MAGSSVVVGKREFDVSVPVAGGDGSRVHSIPSGCKNRASGDASSVSDYMNFNVS